MNGVGISAALDTIHDNRSYRYHTLVGLVSGFTVDQSAKKSQLICIRCNGSSVCLALSLCFFPFSDADDLHGLPFIDVKFHIHIVRVYVSNLIIIIYTDPVTVYHINKFYGIIIGKQSVNISLHIGLHPDSDSFRIKCHDPVPNILGHSLCLLPKEKILILGPADHIAGL